MMKTVMGDRCKYRRREKTTVVAVRLDLETEGFTYQKWGGAQRCKPGDWLVDNGGDIYTIDADVFSKTYRMVGDGVYEKQAPVWAEKAATAGTIRTKEGSTDYGAGDFLVFNDEEGEDGYAISAQRFHSLYEATE